MHKPVKYLDKGMSIASNLLWHGFRFVNDLIPENPSFTPKWSDKPLLKSYQKSKPPLGWPRRPIRCVPAAFRRSARTSWTANRTWRC